MPKPKNGKSQLELDIDDWPLDMLVRRAMFADWYYLRAGELVTSPKGKECWEGFLKGELIVVRK